MSDRITDNDCIFCKIIRGELPCSKVYEDDHVLAFLDISPVTKGHTLVVPKDHYQQIGDLPEETSANLFRMVPRIAKAIKEAMNTEGLNLLQSNARCAGQVVDHVHVHLIPRSSDDGLGFRWGKSSYEQGQMEEILGKIKSNL